MSAATKSLRVVVYEGPGAGTLEEEHGLELVRTLLEKGYPVDRPSGSDTTVERRGDEALVVLSALEGEAPASAEGTTVLDAKAPVEDVLQRVGEVRAAAGVAEPGAWTPWFPVIDFDRCTNCMQCLSFCLFDVYGVDGDGQIEVRNEEKCKTNCPACSRVCPEVAILFPKYKKGPINGDVVRKADIASESMKVDISALLGGDIYQSLRGRQKDARSRFSTERDESRALLERKRCLKELKGALDIPDEVLMTLPSAGEIEERAQRAKEKHEKRMARSRTVADTKPAPSPDEWGI